LPASDSDAPPSDIDDSTLELAFLRHVLHDLAAADRVLVDAEQALIARLCPPDRLRAAGLVDEAGAGTPRGEALRQRALDELPSRLSLEARCALITQLVELCVVDGQIDRAEGSLLFTASQLLGLRTSEFDAHLDTLTEHVGSIDLDQPVQIEDFTGQ
jgi:uncharacterized tellurite resistance protein B-like protein